MGSLDVDRELHDRRDGRDGPDDDHPAHPDAGTIAPLQTRPFSFADCLALPGYDAPTKAGL